MSGEFLAHALQTHNVSLVDEICKECPNAIFEQYEHPFCDTFENALVCVARIGDVMSTRIICDTIYRMGISVDTKFKEECVTYCHIASRYGNVDSMRVFMEYGASTNAIVKEAGYYTLRIYDCHKLIARKLQGVRSACCAILRMRVTRDHRGCSRNAFAIVGKDMTRLIAEEVWATRRHPSWEWE